MKAVGYKAARGRDTMVGRPISSRRSARAVPQSSHQILLSASSRVQGGAGVTPTTKGALVALAVAALFGTRGAMAADSAAEAPKGDAKVKCTGVNECAGKGSCAGAGNSCAGKNTCKGMGVLELSAKECAAKGGKVATE
jgi:uncharacterized membrane protein